MTTNSVPSRRSLLKAAVATGFLAPASLSLAACAGNSQKPAASSAAPSGGGSGSQSGGASADNPFGVAKGSAVDAVIFDGGYGTDYVTYAASVLAKGASGANAKITPTTEISAQLQPRFVSKTPPDLVDNSGAQHIPMPTIVNQLADLTDVLNANNLEGTPIKDTLFPGVVEAGTINGQLKAINYVLTVYAMWYSKSLLAANGWTVPKTWDEMMALGKEAKAKNKYLFLWGKEAASYYLIFLLDSAVKEGGNDTRLALANLKPGAWTSDVMVKTANAFEAIIKAGYIKPGGEGVQFTKAQAGWSKDQEALFYHSGSWIENEMKKETKPDFQMTAGLVPTVSASSKLPNTAIHSESGEPFIVPSDAKNLAGGKELLRVMLSKEAAANFAKTKLSSTIVKGTVPADGFGSTALASQVSVLEASGADTFGLPFLSLYGLWSADSNTWFNAFLSGRMDSATLLGNLQKAADKVAADPSIVKTEYK